MTAARLHNFFNMTSTLANTRVLIADDQPVILRGLSMMLDNEDDIDVVGLANDGVEAVEMATELRPDVIIMDLQMPRLSGVEATKNIILKHPDMKIIALTTFDTDNQLSDAIRSGAYSYLLKDAGEKELLATVRDAHRGYTDGPSRVFDEDSDQSANT